MDLNSPRQMSGVGAETQTRWRSSAVSTAVSSSSYLFSFSIFTGTHSCTSTHTHTHAPLLSFIFCCTPWRTLHLKASRIINSLDASPLGSQAASLSSFHSRLINTFLRFFFFLHGFIHKSGVLQLPVPVCEKRKRLRAGIKAFSKEFIAVHPSLLCSCFVQTWVAGKSLFHWTIYEFQVNT